MNLIVSQVQLSQFDLQDPGLDIASLREGGQQAFFKALPLTSVAAPISLTHHDNMPQVRPSFLSGEGQDD
jgi:hypothetical protein